MLEQLLIVVVIIYGLYYYSKQTRLTRQRQRFENAKNDIESLGRHNRILSASKSQKNDMKEIARIAKGYLTNYDTEIPPRLFQSVNELVNQSVKELRFGQVYELYILLLNTNRKRIFSELEQFMDRSH